MLKGIQTYRPKMTASALGTLLAMQMILLGCARPTPENSLRHLNGYWQIVSVERPDGEEKNYGFSNVVDHIEVVDGKGFRKKLTPQVDGSFKTSNVVEAISTNITNDRLQLQYSTEFSQWTEEVVFADENNLTLQNEQGIRYLYRRYQPLAIE